LAETKVKRLLTASALLAVALPAKVTAQNLTPPTFVDFAASSSYDGNSSMPKLSTPEARQYRTRLTEASSQKANFSGHYIVAQWGCGTECISGAVLDALSGEVTFFPFGYVCCWGNVKSDFEPISFRQSSRLIVFSGQLRGKGLLGMHYFTFDNGRFKLVRSIPATAEGFAVPR
jgi:hypothetical protein